MADAKDNLYKLLKLISRQGVYGSITVHVRDGCFTYIELRTTYRLDSLNGFLIFDLNSSKEYE